MSELAWSLAAWVQQVSFVQDLRGSSYAYPLLNAAHIAALAMLFGSVAAAHAMLISAGRFRPALVAVPLGVARLGLLLCLVTGAVLFTVRATEYLINPFMLAKLALIALAIANATILHTLLMRSVRLQEPSKLRVSATASIGLWLLTIVCGRMVGFW